jgi:hypothetical protein
VMLEAASRLLFSGTSFALAIVDGSTAHTVRINPEWLERQRLAEVDPSRLFIEQPSLRQNSIDDLSRNARLPSFIEARIETPIRLVRMLNSLRDAIYVGSVLYYRSMVDSRAARYVGEKGKAAMETRAGRFLRDASWDSTIRAGKNLGSEVRNFERGESGQEYGIHILIRGALQLGAGEKAVMLTLPISLSVGYNTKSRLVSIRRGVRQEKMLGGTAFSAAIQLDVKGFRMNPDIIDGGDPRPGYGALKGRSWWPPSIPFIAFVAESARGYNSWGASFSADLAGAFFTNTENQFTETQKVAYSAPMPDPREFMKRLQRQVADSSSIFDSTFTGGGKCAVLFTPVRAGAL